MTTSTSTYRNYNYRTAKSASVWIGIGLFCVLTIGFAWNVYNAEAIRHQQILSNSIDNAMDSYARNDDGVITDGHAAEQSPQQVVLPVPTATPYYTLLTEADKDRGIVGLELYPVGDTVDLFRATNGRVFRRVEHFFVEVFQ